MTDEPDETVSYRVRTDQPGRANKPVLRHGDGEMEAVEPGETFTVPADADLDALADRIERVGAFDDDGTPETVVADDPPEGDHLTDDTSAAEAASDAAEAASDAANDGEAEQAAESNDGQTEESGPINPVELAAEIGYGDCENVGEVRDLMSEVDLSARQKRALKRYEQENAGRKTAVEAIEDA